MKQETQGGASSEKTKEVDLAKLAGSSNQQRLLLICSAFRAKAGFDLTLRQVGESPATEAAIKLAVYLGIGRYIPQSNIALAKGFNLIADPISNLLWNKMRGFPERIDMTHWREIYNDIISSDYAIKRIENFSIEHKTAINSISKRYYHAVTSNDSLYNPIERNDDRIVAAETSIESILKRWLFFFKPEELDKVNWDELIPGENITRRQGMATLISRAGNAGSALQSIYFDIKIRDEDDASAELKARRPGQPLLVGPPGIGKTWIIKRLAVVTGYDLAIIDSAGDKTLGKSKLLGGSCSGVTRDFDGDEKDLFGIVPALYMRNRKRMILLFDNLDTRAFNNFRKDYLGESSPAELLQSFFDRKNTRHIVGSLGNMEMDLSECIISATTNYPFEIVKETAAIEDRFMICNMGPTEKAEKYRRAWLYLDLLPKKYAPTEEEKHQLKKLLNFIVDNDIHTPGSRQTELAFEMAVSMLLGNRERLDMEGNIAPISYDILESDIKRETLRMLAPDRAKGKSELPPPPRPGMGMSNYPPPPRPGMGMGNYPPPPPPGMEMSNYPPPPLKD